MEKGIYNRLKNFFNGKSISANRHTESCNSYFYIYDKGEAIWSARNYNKICEEAYRKNVIANRCINIIAQGAASVPWQLYQRNNKMEEIKHHPILKLLHRPNPMLAGAEFFENLYAYRMLSGNAYLLSVGKSKAAPSELHILRPDRVQIVPSRSGLPAGYCYSISPEDKKFYPVDTISGQSQVLHLRNFHPLDDWYGLSSIEAAAYSIDQHNQAGVWNQSLLQNGARPSGAMIVSGGSNLSDEQFDRLKNQVEERYSSAANAGRPLLLEGGLEWREMSLSPKDMDFIESKNSAARDIALAFGVPPQLLGIPGDNTYANMQEARLALWEETILPLLDHMTDALNNWLIPMFGSYHLSYNKDEISALSMRRESIWAKLEGASFLTINEKRSAVGLSPIEGGDQLKTSS
jgi:HK97 family phage portal protein